MSEQLKQQAQQIIEIYGPETIATKFALNVLESLSDDVKQTVPLSLELKTTDQWSPIWNQLK